MKKYRLLKLLSAVALLGAGALALVPKKAESASAATNSVTLAGSFNGWNTTAEPLTLNGSYWTIEKTLAVDDEFKVVVNGSDWVGDGAGVSWPSLGGLGSVSGHGSNFKVLTAGTYRIKAVSTIGDYGDKSYGIVLENVVPQLDVVKYEVLDGVVAGSAFETEKVNENTMYDPADRLKLGYSFDGWFTDNTCETPYSRHTITADLVLYAGYTTASWSGTLKIELGALGCSWSEAAANYAIYFFNGSYNPTAEGWSSYVTGVSQGQQFVSVPYSLNFEPAYMIAVRYSPEFTSEAWAANQWGDEFSEWNQTSNISYRFAEANTVIRVGSYHEESGLNDASTGYPKIVGGALFDDMEYLDNYKTNGAGHPEFYDSCHIEKDTPFKIQFSPYTDGTYINTYTAHSSIQAVFSLDGDGNLVPNKTDTYVFYFDDYSLSFYITTQALADADEWAQDFLTGANCLATMAQWSTMKARYNALSSGAKTIISSEAHVAHDIDVEGYVAQAVQRYDYIIERYGTSTYDDYMGRVESQHLVPGSLGARGIFDSVQESGNLVVTIVSVISVSTLAALIVLKKRKAVTK